MDRPVAEIKGISKRYKDVQAVNNLSLTVFQHDIYGFLGPNGSGKSTTIRMLLSLVRMDQGEIKIFGQTLSKDRNFILNKIGSLVEKPDFYEYLSARKNLEFLSMYSGLQPDKKKIEEVLELTGLTDRAKSKVKTYSKGMKQRLGIAQALLHDPEMLVLDEPASGLDPSGIRDIRNLIRFLNREKNKTIILSSHNLQEIEMIANRMVIINKGKKVIEGKVRELLMDHSYYTSFTMDDVDKAAKLLKDSTFEIDKTETEGNQLKVFCQRKFIPEINAYLAHHAIRIESIRTEQNLEDYFLTLT